MNKYFLLLIIAAVSFAQGKSVIAVADVSADTRAGSSRLVSTASGTRPGYRNRQDDLLRLQTSRRATVGETQQLC